MSLFTGEYYYKLILLRVRRAEDFLRVCEFLISVDVEITTEEAFIASDQEASRVDDTATVDSVVTSKERQLERRQKAVHRERLQEEKRRKDEMKR